MKCFAVNCEKEEIWIKIYMKSSDSLFRLTRGGLVKIPSPDVDGIGGWATMLLLLAIPLNIIIALLGPAVVLAVFQGISLTFQL